MFYPSNILQRMFHDNLIMNKLGYMREESRKFISYDRVGHWNTLCREIQSTNTFLLFSKVNLKKNKYLTRSYILIHFHL